MQACMLGTTKAKLIFVMPAGVLLHHLETHIGIVVLITNKPEAIDTAFQRRIRFSMTFPMPDAPLR